MKKFAITALAAASMLGAGAAHAYTTGTYSNGFVVPHVYFDGAGDTTAIGITNRSGDSVPVYWAFFDEDSRKIQDSCFDMTKNEFKPFIWSEVANADQVGNHGYMVFAAGDRGDECYEDSFPDYEFGFDGLINGAAYQVTTSNMNAETVPTLTGDLWFTAGTDLTRMDADSLEYVEGAFDAGTAATVRFYNPGSTEWVIWSTFDQTDEAPYTINTYNFNQAHTSASLEPDNAELNVIDVRDSGGQISSWPDSFREGFSVVDMSASDDGSWFIYARIAQADGANIQTYLGVEDTGL